MFYGSLAYLHRIAVFFQKDSTFLVIRDHQWFQIMVLEQMAQNSPLASIFFKLKHTTGRGMILEFHKQ